MSDCELCRGTGRVPVLDVWAIAEMGGIADHLPMLPEKVPCPVCCGEEAHDDAMRAIMARRGNPFVG